MTDRRRSLTDSLLSTADNALRTLFAGNATARRSNPAAATAPVRLDPEDARHAAGLMRVNHSGEIAAQGLYQGHAAVARNPAVAREMRRAAAEEADHLAWCAGRLRELDSRPSRLAPLWYAGAYTIGALSGLAGDRWGLGFIAETERQVVEHLENHLRRLPVADDRSRAILETMAEEEAAHGEDAELAGAASLPPPLQQMMRLTASVMTRTAYWI